MYQVETDEEIYLEINLGYIFKNKKTVIFITNRYERIEMATMYGAWWCCEVQSIVGKNPIAQYEGMIIKIVAYPNLPTTHYTKTV